MVKKSVNADSAETPKAESVKTPKAKAETGKTRQKEIIAEIREFGTMLKDAYQSQLYPLLDELEKLT